MTTDRIEIFRGEDGDWYFRRVARNGERGNPSEGYTRRSGAIRAAIRWNRDVPPENYVDKTRGGLRVQSALLDDWTSEADDA